MEFNPKNTAIIRKKPSAPLKFLLKRHFFISKKYHKILDYGCGRGYDVTWLQKNGYDAQGWDPNWGKAQKPGPEDLFDTVLCSYVLNVIADPEERLEVLRDAWSHVAPAGVLFVAMRCAQEVDDAAAAGKWERYGDGYISSQSKKTFQVGYTCQSVNELLNLVDMDVHYVEVCDRTRAFAYLIVTK